MAASVPAPQTPQTPQRPGALLRARARARRARVARPLVVAGAAIAAAWAILAVFAPLIAPHDPLAQEFARFQPPSGAHLLGTDELGRDVLSRVIHGARVSLPLAALLVALSLLVGGTLGALAGYRGGIVDALVMRLADLVFAFPTIILAMAVAAALGADLRNAVLAVLVVSWPSYARVVRGLVLSLRGADYVIASRLLGASAFTALRRDVLPNVLGPVAVLATLDLGNAILLLSGLSFLGLGAKPPTAEWGSMVATGAQNFDFWWVGTFPGLAILTAVLAFNFIGDALRDRLDPRTARNVGGRSL
ncbi:MAG TPA: ABC transporter permease [Solirubrobacteraceae bacterium]|jgi:peptide/nickel transport system permease protein|nr:ABC transporter permease [Solirubrobacteraceae bacterium]